MREHFLELLLNVSMCMKSCAICPSAAFRPVISRITRDELLISVMRQKLDKSFDEIIIYK